MFIPGARCTAEPEDTADIMLNENEYFGFCETFKYLGTTIDNKLDDSVDVKKRIHKAAGAFACMKRVLKDEKIPVKLRLRAYEATVLNILIFGCESWALKEEDRRKLEACHHMFLRSILKVSKREVREYHIRNETIREELGCYSLHQSMELRRARWLEKLAKMPATRNPRKVFVSWTPKARPIGRPTQSIRHGYATTVETSLGFQNSNFNTWMGVAKNHQQWANRVEKYLGLRPGTYKKFKIRRLQT